MRLAIRVKPGSARTEIGGVHGDALVVRVTARAVAGQATEAALRAVADALGVPRSRIRVLTGRTSRDKIVEIADPPPHLAARVQALRDGRP